MVKPRFQPENTIRAITDNRLNSKSMFPSYIWSACFAIFSSHDVQIPSHLDLRIERRCRFVHSHGKQDHCRSKRTQSNACVMTRCPENRITLTNRREDILILTMACWVKYELHSRYLFDRSRELAERESSSSFGRECPLHFVDGWNFSLYPQQKPKLSFHWMHFAKRTQIGGRGVYFPLYIYIWLAWRFSRNVQIYIPHIEECPNLEDE